MSITTTLRRATKLQEKIEELRGQLADLLDKARSEIVTSPALEVPATPRRGRKSKVLKGKARSKAAPPEPTQKRDAKKVDGRTKVARARKAGKRSPLAGVKRAASPSGPLAPAVVKVLQAANKPMSVSAILDQLLAKGYQFNSAEPKKNLAARIYRLNGVKQVDVGQFAAA